MELVDSFAGGSSSGSVGLGTYSNVKPKCLVGAHLHGASYKKSKKPAAVGDVVNMFAGPLSFRDLDGAGVKPVMSWGSNVSSIVNSISGFLGKENIMNMIAKETSYAESGEDDNVDDTMLRKTCTHTFALDNPMKQSFFNILSNNNSVLKLSFHTFNGSNQLLPLNFNLAKSFALDIELSAVPRKTNGDKLLFVKKIFYRIDSFGGALTPSKFPGVIRSTFTSESSLNKAKLMVISKKIIINSDLKKIPVNLPKSALEVVFFKFGKINFIRMQLIGLWQKATIGFNSAEVVCLVASKWSVLVKKDSVYVVLAVNDKESWALLYTLPVGITAHDLSDLLELYVYMFTVICFENKVAKLTAVGLVLVFKGVGLCWAGFGLICCTQCKQLSYIAVNCSMYKKSGRRGKQVVTSQNQMQLANIYKKKQASITCPSSFGGKTWAQVAGGSFFCVVFLVSSNVSVSSSEKLLLLVSSPSDVFGLNDYLAALKCFLELLADQVLDILKRLNGAFFVPEIAVSNSNMLLDHMLASSAPFPLNVDVLDAGIGSSVFKVLTTKMSGLESKLLALEAFVDTVLARLDLLCSGADSSLTCHVSRVEEVSSQVISVRLLFKDKLSVTFLELYVGASSGVRFGQASEVNSLIAKAVNSSTFVVLGGNFNENESGRSLVLLGELFSGAKSHENMNTMWVVLEKAVVESADVTFSRHWFSKFRCSRNKHSFKFCGLELLVAKIVKAYCFGDLSVVNCLAHAFNDLVCSGVKSEVIIKHLSLVRKDYRRSKMFELRLAKEASIRKTVERHMEKFCSNKGSIIRSVLDKPFHKVVLNHLVVDNKLVLEPEKVKLGVNKIIKEWTRKHSYTSLDYVWDNAFSGVIYAVSMDKLLLVVVSLLDDKTTGGFEVPVEAVECVFGCWLGACFMKKNPIALIETTRKILSKILADYISVACSKFNVLQDDNFSVLKGMFIQSLVFAVRSVIEDALEKNRKVWLVLQDIQKAYNLHIKMCNRFIRFFGSIHKDRVNRVITDFDLSGGYRIHDGLDQVKRHKQLCRYQIDTKFVLKTGRIKSGGDFTSYFSASAFVDNIIWVGNCQASTQYALNIASEFFEINNIFINSEKTVAISINQGVKVASLSICGQPILIAKKSKAHYYLDIFLSTEGLSKLSVTKAYANVHFFINIVLRKAITDKQFLYLVSVLQVIIWGLKSNNKSVT
ncbi:hypothetical protein G9A89_003395 [Geosiphon pyriformis]|nr:hypothetical protein G9A89_003395 [Geosiphon pyriformis]